MSLKITRSDGEFLRFDTATAIANAQNIAVSSHPIEDGSEVTDHVQRGPDSWTVTAILSRTPLGAASDLTGDARISDAVSFLSSCVGDLLEATIPKIGTVKNVMLTGYNNSHSSGDATFTIAIQSMTIAVAESIIIPAPAPAAEPTMADPRDAGVQPTEQGTETERDKSLVLGIIGALS